MARNGVELPMQWPTIGTGTRRHSTMSYRLLPRSSLRGRDPGEHDERGASAAVYPQLLGLQRCLSGGRAPLSMRAFTVVNAHGVPKPAFRAFELLANLTGRRVPVDAVLRGGKSGVECAQNVHVLSTWEEGHTVLQLIVANHDSQLGNSTPARRAISQCESTRPGLDTIAAQRSQAQTCGESTTSMPIRASGGSRLRCHSTLLLRKCRDICRITHGITTIRRWRRCEHASRDPGCASERASLCCRGDKRLLRC